MLKKITLPGERIAEEKFEDTDDSYRVSDTASIGDIGESSDISSPNILPSDSVILSPGSTIPSPAYTRSYGKAKNTKDREPLHKGYGVVYLPADISGFTKKLHLLAAEFFAANTAVRNELVHVLDALLR